MNQVIENEEFELNLDEDTVKKFAQILNDESLVHACNVAHQANNVTFA